MSELDTGTADLLASVDDGLAVLTLSRPERRNALSAEMVDALARMLVRLEADDEVRCVVLTGAGGAFCAGGDVKDFAAGARGSADSLTPAARADGAAAGRPGASFDQRVQAQRLLHRRIALRLWQLPKPTVAVLPGAAAGAGLSLALACDLRYAADTAVLTTAFARVALAGDFGGSWLLTRLVGTAKARELYYFSERLDAAQAHRLGLVNAVYPADRLLDAALGQARRLAAGPAVAYRYMKENLNRATTHELTDCLDIEAVHHQRTFDTADHREAAAAFVEKREPRFSGS
jgi:2-(1,2-epoxy-1,2-dihydrophenyl)acetyl-CoA isomerase